MSLPAGLPLEALIDTGSYTAAQQATIEMRKIRVGNAEAVLQVDMYSCHPILSLTASTALTPSASVHGSYYPLLMIQLWVWIFNHPSADPEVLCSLLGNCPLVHPKPPESLLPRVPLVYQLVR